MKIVRAHEFGGPDKLVVDDIDLPQPGPGQVRVAVHAVGVNPVDWKLLSGKAPVLPPLPLVPGGDVAGTIDAVGAGVEGLSPGARVFVHPGLTGSYAAAIVVDATAVAAMPKAMDFAEAASLPLVSLTAWQGFLADGRDLTGLHVLVHNAAGGVGMAAVQIAKARGARVTGTASAVNAAFVQSLGADAVVDFRTAPVEGRARDVDILLDLVGNSKETGLWALVREGGSVIRIAGGADAPPVSDEGGIRGFKVRVRPSGEQLSEIATLVDGGKLRTEIAQSFPLVQAADALKSSMSGHVRGKIVLTVE